MHNQPASWLTLHLQDWCNTVLTCWVGLMTLTQWHRLNLYQWRHMWVLASIRFHCMYWYVWWCVLWTVWVCIDMVCIMACIGMYFFCQVLHILVSIGMYWEVICASIHMYWLVLACMKKWYVLFTLVCIDIYWYILIYIDLYWMYWYVLVCVVCTGLYM